MPREKAIDKLSDKQVVALAKFIDDNGRNWRGRLDSAWTTGHYPTGADIPTLQQLRNNDGPEKIQPLEVRDIRLAARKVIEAGTQASG